MTDRSYPAPESSNGLGSSLQSPKMIVRERVLKTETKKQAQKRWERERQIEADRERENRRDFTGRVYPVRYED